MSDRLSDLEARMERVEDAVRALSRAMPAAGSRPGELPEASPAPIAAGWDVPVAQQSVALLTLTGRTLMILGGAYLLRALVDSGLVASSGGVLLGLTYAAFWLGAADRVAADRSLSGLFHGLTAVLIAFPLLWEASTRFELLSPGPTAAVLSALSAVALIVAWHRRLQGLAGVAVIAALMATAALIVRTGRPLPFVAHLLALAAGTLWLAERRAWWWLRLPATVSLAIGLAGSLFVTATTSTVLHTALAGLTLAIAAGSYAAAFGVRRWHLSDGASGFYATLALGLTTLGAVALVSGTWLVTMFSALALGATVLHARADRPMVALHGAVFAAAATLAAGLARLVAETWLTALPWLPATGAQIGATCATAACSLVAGAHIAGRSGDASLRSRAARGILALLVVAGVGTLGVRVLSSLVAAATPGALAAVRTVILAVAALSLAWCGRIARLREYGAFVYPMLAAGAIKLAVDDLPHATPAILFFSFGIYGAALILAPRIARRS